MNYRLLLKVLGLLVLLVGTAMLVCEVTLLLDERTRDLGTHDFALLKSFGVATLLGALLLLGGRGSGDQILRKEAIAIVGLGWLISTLVGALPFLFASPALSPAAAFFESASGFTTTGATTIPDLNLCSPQILLWRSTTQWLGGMGILVLFVALLSTLGVGSKSLLKHESSAQSGFGFHTRIRQIAMRLWQIYTVLTVFCVLGLILLGMTPFDSVIHAFAAISTGGFSSRNESVAFYDSASIDAWLCVFMILGGMSFPLLAWLVRGGFKNVRKDEELRLFLAFLIVATAIITIDLAVRREENLFRGLQIASFQVVSIMTTTGFCTADFDTWPTLSKALLVTLMFVGGCSGSTSGGIKVSRVAIFFKTTGQQLRNSFRPNQHIPIRMNGETLEEEQISKAMFFIALTAFVVAFVTLLITLLEPQLDLVSSFTAVVASLFNIGPGLGEVGASKNFAFFSPVSHLLLGMVMILGRLEFFGVLALFIPALWKRY
ncbi:MAG: TrkH family potassium uptake protein [Terrimicrobiaceae bacterium]